MLLQGYLQQGLSVEDLSQRDKLKHSFDITKALEARLIPSELIDSAPAWRKSVFCPYKQERDHLGRILDSVSFILLTSLDFCNCLQTVRVKTGIGLIRREVKFQQLKDKTHMTFKTNVPERWLDRPDQLPFAVTCSGLDSGSLTMKDPKE